jgi:hypothetical protein
MTVGPQWTRGLVKEVQMKKIVAALASASLLAAPLALGPTPAMAQHSHGGMGGHSFAGRGAGFHSSGFRGGFRGGYRGGFNRGGYYRGGYYRGYPFAGAAIGLFLGAAIADSWYDDYPGYYGYYGPYGSPYADDYYAVPPPPDAYDDDGAPPPPQYQSPPQGAAGPGQACGSWSWNAAQSKYDWVPC